MKQRPTKAVIPVAGYGTRRLPITKAIEKCMLPILNRPIVDYVVEDCAKAGITDVLFIISDQGDQLKKYYSPNSELEDYLASKGKLNELAELKEVGYGMNFHYKVQARDKYGTAIPVLEAKDFIGDDEAFVVMMGDDFIYHESGGSTVDDCITAWQQSEATHALISANIEREQVSSYGVIKLDDSNLFEGIVDTPSIEEAPSTQINVSKYIFSSSIFSYLAGYVNMPRVGEYLVTDVINNARVNNENILVVPAKGTYLDGGSTAGWLHANQFLAQQ